MSLPMTSPHAAPLPPLDAYAGGSDEQINAILERELRLEEGLLGARSSQALVHAALEYLAHTFNAAAFFVVQGPLVVGRDAIGDPALSRLVLPAQSPTTFGRAIASRQPVYGPLGEGDADAVIHRRAKRPVPEEVLCAPIVVDGVCVGLLYADRLTRGAAIDPSLPLRLGRMVGAAFLDLFARDLEGLRARARAEGRDEAGREGEEILEAVTRLAEARVSDPDARRWVARVLELGEACVDALIDHFPGRIDETAAADPDRCRGPEGHGVLIDALLQAPKLGLEVALAAVSDSNPLRRRYGAMVLGRVAGPDDLQPLFALLDDGDEQVAQAAAVALSGLRDPKLVRRAGEQVVELLDPEVPVRRVVRSRAILVAGALGCTRAIDHLMRLLDDPVVGRNADQALEAICFHSPKGRDRARAWRHFLGSAGWRHDAKARARFALMALERNTADHVVDATTHLYRSTGHDFGFRAGAPRAEREAAIARWRAALGI